MKSEIIFIHPLNIEVEFIIGRCQEEIYSVIDLGQENDIWFHANQISSCHVIALISKINTYINKDTNTDKDTDKEIKINKKDLRYIIKQGAILCKQYTNRAKNEKNFEVVYTELKYLEKTNIQGQVRPDKQKYIKI